MTFFLAGIGTALPEHFISQEDAAREVAALCCSSEEERRRLELIYRRSGVSARRSVLLESSSGAEPPRHSFFPPRVEMPLGPTTAARMQRYDVEVRPLAIRAAREALVEARIDASEITHLVTASCTGFGAPGVDVALIQELGLPPHTQRTHIGFMGCHAAMNALRVAGAFIAAERSACALVCAVELCSLHQQYGWRMEQVVAGALFADGAAAVVGTGAAPRRGADDAWRYVASESIVIPGTTELMGWRIADHGFEMTLSTDLPGAIQASLRPWLAGWLERHGLTIGDVGSWAIHPGGPKILEATAKAAGFDPGQLADSQGVLHDLGNMSSPTILFILDRLRRRGAARPCVALAFGPGLAIEGALFR